MKLSEDGLPIPKKRRNWASVIYHVTRYVDYLNEGGDDQADFAADLIGAALEAVYGEGVQKWESDKRLKNDLDVDYLEAK